MILHVLLRVGCKLMLIFTHPITVLRPGGGSETNLWNDAVRHLNYCPVTFFQMSHAATSAFCRSIKLQCELYPSREVAICLDPYCGLGFVLWCLCR